MDATEDRIPLWPLVVFHLLLAVKLYLVSTQIGYAVESGFSALAILGFAVFEDGAVLGALVLLLLASRRAPRLGSGLAAALLAVYALDLALFQTLFSRLTLLNLTRYGLYVDIVATFVKPTLLIVSALIVGAAWLVRKRLVPVPGRRLVAAAAVVLVALPLGGRRPRPATIPTWS